VLEPTWNWLHASIDPGKAAPIRQAGRGLVIDLCERTGDVPRTALWVAIAQRCLSGERIGTKAVSPFRPERYPS